MFRYVGIFNIQKMIVSKGNWFLENIKIYHVLRVKLREKNLFFFVKPLIFCSNC